LSFPLKIERLGKEEVSILGRNEKKTKLKETAA